jgi:hypothetical protein
MEAFLESIRTSFVSAWGIIVIFFRFAPYWAPVFFVFAGWKSWMRYRRALFLSKKEPVLLEIRLPKEIDKSPLAMEMVLNALFATGGEGTWKDRYWLGGVRPWFSLELVSLEGRVKFFIWTWRDSVKSIQNSIYAQYPMTEVVEVSDYTLAFLYDPDKADISAAEFVLSKADPYPIKTYVDYKLDKDPKEEYKIDPMAPVLEYLGGLGKGEQAWIQIIVRAHKKEDSKKGSLFSLFSSFEDVFDVGKKIKEHFEKTDQWKDDVKKEVDSIIKKRKIKSGKDEEFGMVQLTDVEKDMITALERSITKLPFDVGIRTIYLAEQEYFNKSNKGALNGVFAQYNTQHLNGFKKVNGTSFDYDIQDPFGWRVARMKREMFEAYRLRSYFHPPFKRNHYVLNSEELATIYHFPGGTVATPTFARIESQKAEPPMNLPI